MVALIALGLASVPVECSVAMGPHSIFIAAEDVAKLQGAPSAGSPHAHMDAMGTLSPASHEAGGMAASNGHDMASMTTAKASHSTPDPAGVAMDAIVAMSIPDTRQDLGVAGTLAAMLGDLLLPPGRLLPAPEPPPP